MNKPKPFIEKTNDILKIVAVVFLILFQVGTFLISYSNGEKADEIHLMVNSNLDSVKRNLSEALKSIEALKDERDSNRQIIKNFKK